MAKSIYCFVPCFGQQVSSTTFLSVTNLMQCLTAKGIAGGLSSISYPDIAELRNMSLTIWYDTLPFSHILYIDADIGFDAQMILDMILLDEPVVGALYPKRTFPIQWAASGMGDEKAEIRAGFMEVQGVGMGCTLISREAIKIMLEKMPDLSDPRIEMHSAKDIFKSAGITRIIRAFDLMHDTTVGRISEDLAFCRRWRACGGRVWASIAYKMQHVGMYPFVGCYLESMQAMEKEKLAREDEAKGCRGVLDVNNVA